ncbi:Sodium/hydrogen exchanger family-domain-containing protein [Tuber indicum]|nr:Sodium/hydrogen exchanger family-domain-containing protein [Tuber indicum]
MAGGSGNSTGAANQAGVLEGMNPSRYNPNDPLTLFIIQVTLIIVVCRLLHWPLSKLRQPRVIAEVVGGIILGPTVMGRIPGFRDAIFPKTSMPLLSLVANLGLVIFLFLVGLEVDMRLLVVNWKVAVSVSAAGMVLPFGFGAAIAYGLYHQFKNDSDVNNNISFGVYLLFIGVAMAITAFPVLARILTELELLGTSVGTIVLSAGVGNDVVGWILLALTVALVNAGTGLTALYVLLLSIAWILFLVYAVRPVFIWFLRRDGSLENGPTQSMVALTMLMVLASAFFTNIIGIHAIFGGFLIGLICPHEGGFAVRLTEKIEDLVSVLFLPLYFTLSGLRTDIGLLNGAVAWGYVIGVLTIAFLAKIAGGTVAARLNGLVWRESLTIGVLMSCKGLVELIVLNIGLQAGILGVRVFTIFVIMALVTTFATTPLVTYLYPPDYQKKMDAWRKGKADRDGNPIQFGDDDSSQGTLGGQKAVVTRFSKITVLLRLESMPSILTFVNLLAGERVRPAPKVHKSKAAIPEEDPLSSRSDISKRPLEVHGVRLVELTQRTSAVMQVSEVDELQDRDPVVNVFRSFGKFLNMAVSAVLFITPESSFAETLVGKAADRSSDLLLIPWSETGAMSDAQDAQYANTENRFTTQQHNLFISKALDTAACTAAIMVNRGFGGPLMERTLSRAISQISVRSRKNADSAPVPPVADPSHHIFFPFFGGPDDTIAMRFVLQLATNTNVTATIVRVAYKAGVVEEPLDLPAPANIHRPDLPRGLSTSNVPTLSREDTAKDSTAQSPATAGDPAVPDAVDAFFQSMADSVPAAISQRVLFETVETAQPIHYVISRAKGEVGQSKNAGDLIIVGRCQPDVQPDIRRELVSVLASLGVPSGAGNETRKCLGDMAEAIIVSGIKASMIVLKAGGKALEPIDG